MPINYVPSLKETAGFFESPKPDADSKPIGPTDQKTLLNLLWWLNYTKKGRDFLKDNRVVDKAPEIIADAFKTKLAEYGIPEGPLLTAIINAHFAANRYVVANGLPPGPAREDEKQKQDKIYQQNMSFVCWRLWEDVQDHEFSMNW